MLNYKKLPVHLVASLSLGLRENSRLMMRVAGAKANTNTMLLASAVDRLSLLVWAQSKDATKGINRPKSIVKDLIGEKEKYETFGSGKAFERRKAEILGA